MGMSESMKGPRLEFVVKEIRGTIKRPTITPPPNAEAVKANPGLRGETQNVRSMVTKPAGFLVYLPSGHCYRMDQKELIRRGFHRQPTVLSLEQANDTKTAAGRFKLALTESERMKAYREMEDEVIKNCIGVVGKDQIAGLVSDYDPNGKIEERKAA